METTLSLSGAKYLEAFASAVAGPAGILRVGGKRLIWTGEDPPPLSGPRARLAPALSAPEAAVPAKPTMAGEYLSTDDAAAVAGVSAASIRAWAKLGRLTVYKAGRLLRIKRADLEDMMRGGASAESTERTDQIVARMLGRSA